MAASTGNSAGGKSHRPVPLPRGLASPPPALPAKLSDNSERDVDTRLGIAHQTSFNSSLPTPPDFSGEPFPRSASGSEDMPAVVAKDPEEDHLYENTKEPDQPAPGSEKMTAAKPKDTKKRQLYENVEEFDKFGNAKVVPTSSLSSTQNEPSSVSPRESVSQPEGLQMRPRFSALAEASGAKGNRMSQLANSNRVSKFLDVVEKSTKFEKPTPAQKPGQLIVPKGLERKLTTVLVRQRTMRAVQEVEDPPDIGIDVAGSETSSTATKLSVSSSDSTKSARSYAEDSKSMLHTVKYFSIIYGQLFRCFILLFVHSHHAVFNYLHHGGYVLPGIYLCVCLSVCLSVC